MESRQCVICGINFDLKTENIPLTIISNKLLFDNCLHLFKIKENCYNDLYRWKWDARFDSPNFCEICCTNIQTLSELNENLEILQKERETAALHSQITIINSTSIVKRIRRKKFTVLKKPDSLSVIDKIDYFRSTAVLALEPVIRIKKFDEKKESNDEDIIEIGGPRNLIQSKEEIYQFFNVVDGKFQCKICFTEIKDRRNAKRHYNDIHQRFKGFKCAICKKKFYIKSKCRNHINQNHNDIIPKKTIPPVILPQTPEEAKCLLCYISVKDEKVQISSEVLNSFSSLLNFTPPKFMMDFAISCVGCSSYLMDLHNLRCNLEQVGNEFVKLLLQVKTDVLLSISSNKIQKIKENDLLCSVQINVAAKIDHFQRLAVRDLIPVISLFNIKLGNATKPQQERTPQDNSIFKLIKEEEIISIMDDETSKAHLKNEMLLECFRNDEGKYTCLVCNTFYSSFKTAFDHYNKHHNQISRYQCKYCSVAFYYRSECAKHIVVSHKMERVEIEAEIENKLKSQSDIITTPDGVISIPKGITTANVSKNDIIKIKDKAYKCAMCSKIFKHRDIVRVHQVKVHLQGYRFKCEFCGLKNYHKHSILYHIRRVHPEKQKLIDERSNGKTAAPPPHLAKKLSKPKGKRPPLNPSFLRGMKVLETKTIHNIDDYFTVVGSRYSCKTCGREYTVRRLLIEHIERVHFGVRRYECGVCAKKFYQYSQCKNHIRKNHPDQTEVVSGTESMGHKKSEKIPSNQNFDDDTDFLNGEEQPIEIPIKLDIEVGEAFGCSIDIEDPFMKTEDNVQIMDLCNNNNDYVRSESDVKEENTFIVSSEDAELIVGLDNNKEMTNEKCLLYKLIKPGEIITLARSPNYGANLKKGLQKVPEGFKCLKCYKVFKKRTIYIQHWGIVHDKTGGYQCSVCQKRFYAKFHCAKHFIHKHTDRNPYVCPTCDGRFNSNRSLRKHIQKHMGERRFTCSMCPLKFVEEVVMTKHIENVHMKILGS